MRDVAQVVDVGPSLGRPVRAVLKIAGARRTASGWRSQWHHLGPAVRLLEADVQRRVAASGVDAVVQIQDLAPVDAPFLVVQDLSYALLLDRFGADLPHLVAVGPGRVEELRRRQERIYAKAAALVPMSSWLARSLVVHGIPESKVVVVHPGVNVPLPPDPGIPVRRRGVLRRLLMVGRDFDRKAGPQVVAAFAQLRRELGERIELTIAGPPSWPLRGPVPDGVTFLGQCPPSAVARLMDGHDLFVMPSRFEAFGIVFVEALVRGLPCIGRDDFAMPEIIDPVSGGRLVTSDRPDELAELILAALNDDQLYEECARAAPARRDHYSWRRAAQEIVGVAERIS